MFKKFLTLVSLTTFASVALAGMAAGCSSSSNNNPITPTADAGDDSGGNVDTGTDSGSGNTGGPAACYSASDALFITESMYTTIYPGGKCTSGEVVTFYNACLDPNATNDTCDAVQVTPDCLTCLEIPNSSTSDSPRDFPAVYADVGYWRVAAGVCLAMQLNMPQCALPWQNQQFVCPVHACQSCTDDDSRSTCEDQAVDDICTTGSQVPAECQSALDALDGTEPEFTACFGSGDFASIYQATATALCVTGAP